MPTDALVCEESPLETVLQVNCVDRTVWFLSESQLFDALMI